APAVVAAGEPRRVALALVHHLGAAMAAAVEQHVHLAVAVTHHDHGLAAELGGDVIAGRGNLARMPDIEPGAAEDALHLELEDRGIGIDVAVHAAGLDQLRDVIGVSVAHGRSLSPFVPAQAGTHGATRRAFARWVSDCAGTNGVQVGDVTPRPDGRSA